MVIVTGRVTHGLCPECRDKYFTQPIQHAVDLQLAWFEEAREDIRIIQRHLTQQQQTDRIVKATYDDGLLNLYYR